MRILILAGLAALAGLSSAAAANAQFFPLLPPPPVYGPPGYYPPPPGYPPPYYRPRVRIGDVCQTRIIACDTAPREIGAPCSCVSPRGNYINGRVTR